MTSWLELPSSLEEEVITSEEESLGMPVPGPPVAELPVATSLLTEWIPADVVVLLSCEEVVLSIGAFAVAAVLPVTDDVVPGIEGTATVSVL